MVRIVDVYVAGSALTLERVRALAPEAQAGDRRAQEEMVLSVVNLVRAIACRFTGGDKETTEEYTQAGMAALPNALRTFDPERGRWSTHAGTAARYAIIAAVTDRHVVRVPEGVRGLAHHVWREHSEHIGVAGHAPSVEVMAGRLHESESKVEAAWLVAHGPCSRGAVSLSSPSDPHGDRRLDVAAKAADPEGAADMDRRDACMRAWIRDTILRLGGTGAEADVTILSVMDGLSTNQIAVRGPKYRLNHRRVKEAVERGLARLRSVRDELPQFLAGKAAA